MSSQSCNLLHLQALNKAHPTSARATTSQESLYIQPAQVSKVNIALLTAKADDLQGMINAEEAQYKVHADYLAGLEGCTESEKQKLVGTQHLNDSYTRLAGLKRSREECEVELMDALTMNTNK